MGRSADEWQRKSEEDQRVAMERADAAYFALPEAMHANLQVGREIHRSQQELVAENAALRVEVENLQRKIDALSSPIAKWRERGIGLALGILASVIASVVWWQAGKQWPVIS